jgi:hypothetical protein
VQVVSAPLRRFPVHADLSLGLAPEGSESSAGLDSCLTTHRRQRLSCSNP